MPTSSVSSAAVSQAMRYSLLRMQSDLVKAQKEVSTGRAADVGLALGARTSQTVSFSRDLGRLNGILDSNALVASRLSSTQDALGQISQAAQSFLSTLTAGLSGDAPRAVVQDEAQATLDALTAILNSSLNGEHLFAGANTDVRPINSYAAASPAKAAFDAAFLARFGFAQTDPAAGAISQADMQAFLDTDVAPQFLGAGWSNWSNATDATMVSRIALNETTQTSVSANGEGLRKLAMAAATITDLFASTVGEGGQAALIKKAVALVGEALGDIANVQSQAGIAENRVKDASERVKMQADLFERHIGHLEGVDPYEASSRVSSLLAQIETSYALTARIQQLSLARFLG